MDYNEDPDPFCRDCAGWRKKADRLEAQLAAVEKERDEARDLHARAVDLGARVLENETTGLRQQHAALRADNAQLLANADADALMLTQVGRERDAALARVKALEAALDISDGAALHLRWCQECAEGDPCCADIADAIAQVSARVRARAGLTKEGT